MKTTLKTAKAKAKVRPEPVVAYADNPLFQKLYLAALTGLLSHPLTYLDPCCNANVPLDDSKEILDEVKGRTILAWNVAVYSLQEFQMVKFNANVDHE
jgi:hypothetical protein